MKLQAAKPVTLRLPPFQCVFITLVGCGGTGSHLASGLAALALALRESGHPTLLRFVDPDTVEARNVMRQLFAPADVGLAKSYVLSQRVCIAFGLPYECLITAVEAQNILVGTKEDLSLVVGAVDNAAARKVIASAVEKAKGQLWVVDAGNKNHSGQVLIGNCGTREEMKGAIALGMIDRLPSPYLVIPDLIDSKAEKRERPRSCADAAVAGEQGLMTNRMMAAWTLTMLHDFLFGQLHYFGVYVDLQCAGTKPLLLDIPTLSEVTGLKSSELRSGGKHA